MILVVLSGSSDDDYSSYGGSGIGDNKSVGGSVREESKIQESPVREGSGNQENTESNDGYGRIVRFSLVQNTDQADNENPEIVYVQSDGATN